MDNGEQHNDTWHKHHTNHIAPEPNMTDVSRVPPMVYVEDEGLGVQFLTGDEASQKVMNITANKVTTPVDTENPFFCRHRRRLVRTSPKKTRSK